MIEVGTGYFLNIRHIVRANISNETLLVWLSTGERIQFGGDAALNAWAAIKSFQVQP